VIDSHAHISTCDGSAEDVVAEASRAGVSKILTVGLDAKSSAECLELASKFDGVFAAVGHHPTSADTLSSSSLELLRSQAADPRCVAVGETGLDYYRQPGPSSEQFNAFEVQIDLARTVDKPLVIHTRNATEDTINFLDQHAGGLRVLIHCFSMADRVKECIDRGWWCSFAGNTTYPKSQDLRDAAALIPQNRILVETDAPYLTPQPMRGKRNRPAYVVDTAEVVANARGCSYAELEAVVEQNAAELFGW